MSIATQIDPQTTTARAAELPSEADLRELLDAAQVGLFVVQDELIRFATPALCQLVGWPLESLLGRPHGLLVTPEHRERTRAVVQTGRPGEFRCLRRDGTSFDARAQAVQVNFDAQPAMLVTLSDVSDFTHAVRQAHWNGGMLDRTESLCRSGSFEIEMPTGRLEVSEGLRALVGWSAEAPPQTDLDNLAFVPAEERALVAGIWRGAVPGEPFEFQHRLDCKGGGRLTVLHRGVLHEAEAPGAPRLGVAILQDITQQREAEERLQEVANHNEVTGLPNRAHFLDLVDAATHAARWSAGGFTLMALEIPRIGEIKANMGFGAGDALTMAMASRLKQACGPGEQVGHLGDSEFALLMEHDQALDATLIRARAAELQQALAAPVRLAVTDIYARCVIGMARFPGDGELPAELLEHAQTARLGAEAAGGVSFFAPESGARARHEMQIEAGLRQAVARGEFRLVYQPQVDLGSGTIQGAEALLRWTSAELGTIPPSEFIPIAERAGLIGAIGDWVIQCAALQAAAWRSAGLPALRVGVNLSPVQLQRPDLARHVHRLVTEAGADPAWMGIELTESMAMADAAHAATVLRELKALGVEISLDDFGTGHSSLSSLRSLPIDVVKVDRSFVHDVTAAPEQVSVTRAIITMAHGMQMRVLVEGVETEGQLALLAAHRCDGIQGYWFSPPVPPAEFERLLRDDKRLPARYVNGAQRSKTLLLVDDEENILSALKRVLRRDGYQIICASSAREGLQRLAECEVDVIVSDQRMPGMTGVEFLRLAKELFPDTVRIVLSGYTELQSIIDAVNEGAIYRFLTKPWDDERLRAHVAEAFRHKAMADENRRLSMQVETANAELAAMNQRLQHAIDGQREQSDLIAASAEGFREVLNQLPAAVMGIDPEGLITFANREALALLPGAEAMLGQRAATALPPPLRALLDDGAAVTSSIAWGSAAFSVTRRRLQHQGAARGLVFTFVPQAGAQGLARGLS